MTDSPTNLQPLCCDKLKVLADPTRLATLNALMDGPKRVGQLTEMLTVEQSLMSHHLRVLRTAGLVKAQREGKAMRYQLAEGVTGPIAGKAINLGCCLISFDSSAT